MTQINTVIVLRNDQTTNWENSDYVLLKGEVGIGYLDNGNVIAKLGDGEHTWKELKQLEGVFEEDLTLTYDFGKYTTKNGFVVAPAAGKTTSEWLLDALSEIKEPIIVQPSVTLSATTVGGGKEIGSYISAIKWDGTFTDGSYEYCSSENTAETVTGLAAENLSWDITNDKDKQTATTEDGTFVIDGGIQLDSETSKTYATVTAKYTLDASNAYTPLNNVGQSTSGKIENIAETTLTAEATATSYRKPFYGVLTPDQAIDVEALTSTIIRELPNSGNSTKGLPKTIEVPAGSQMVIFAAKADTYKSLTATDDKAMNAEVSFTKVAKAVSVEGANGFTAVDYDIWYVDWNPEKVAGYTGIGSAKKLTLKWA